MTEIPDESEYAMQFLNGARYKLLELLLSKEEGGNASLMLTDQVEAWLQQQGVTPGWSSWVAGRAFQSLVYDGFIYTDESGWTWPISPRRRLPHKHQLNYFLSHGDSDNLLEQLAWCDRRPWTT